MSGDWFWGIFGESRKFITLFFEINHNKYSGWKCQIRTDSSFLGVFFRLFFANWRLISTLIGLSFCRENGHWDDTERFQLRSQFRMCYICLLFFLWCWQTGKAKLRENRLYGTVQGDGAEKGTHTELRNSEKQGNNMDSGWIRFYSAHYFPYDRPNRSYDRPNRDHDRSDYRWGRSQSRLRPSQWRLRPSSRQLAAG